VNASDGRLTADVVGEIELDDGVLVIKRIKVTYRLRVDEDASREKIQRAFDTHMPHCPVYRSIRAAIDITTMLELVES
jgi:uncharacterized OsmC-like protein